MSEYLECVIPGVEQWIDDTYSSMTHPSHYYFVPRGVAGDPGGCRYNSRSLEYCGTGDVYLGEDSVWEQYSIFGDAAPVVVLAHEVTHSFQHNVGMQLTTGRAEIRYENQADCGAGAFMAYAAEQGWMNVEDDIVDLAGSLDAAASAETVTRDHGTSQERLGAFDASYLSGAGMHACVPYVPEIPIIA